jgi:NAD(P)-dependent dehydrogenase (short-subunit alcohol dehydrogenase family)
MDVKGKTAVVFGGTSGIGLATVEQLAAAGANVVAVSRDPSKAGQVPDGVRLAACDVGEREALTALFKKIGAIDVLISSATGGGRAMGPFLEMDLDGFQGSFAKLWGYANVVRLGAEYLAEDGAIVLVSGTPARRPKPGQVALSAVGAAVEALARAIANEIAPRRINVVSPGFIDTPMVPATGKERDEVFAARTKGQAIERAGTSDEVAKAIMFVIGNDYVTGTTVDVDGGWLLS